MKSLLRLPQMLLILLLLATPALAQVDFDETVTFGDSLTHNDLLGFVYGNPQDLYLDDPMEAVFDKAAQAGSKLTNYAIAGSATPDITTQINLYNFFRNLGTQGEATLILFEVGGNDILDNVPLLASYPPFQNPDADAVINGMLGEMHQDLRRLRLHHPDARFIIWTIPDVTLTPGLWGQLTPEEEQNLSWHIERANRLIRRTRYKSFVTMVDLAAQLHEMVQNPPVLFGHQLVGPPATGDYDHLFADEIHPTAVGNALIANEIIEQVNQKWGTAIPVFSETELADLARIPH